MKKVLIAIPAYNEEKKISNVLKPLVEQGFDILLVDDGSSDHTSTVANEFNVNVIKHYQNQGVSQAYRTFINYAIINGYTHIITLDGDGQHDPALVKGYYDVIDKHDIIIGNRFHRPQDAPKEKLSSNFFASMLTKQMCGLFLPDVSCGFRGFSLNFLASIYFDASEYGVIYQIIYECVARGVVPYYFPMKPDYRGQELLTNSTEILSLFDQTDKYGYNNPMLDYKILVKENKPFNIELDGCYFHFKPVSNQAYVISTDTNIAASYYYQAKN